MFRIAICDDEQTICSQIERMLLDYSKRSHLELDIIVFYSGKELYCKCQHKNAQKVEYNYVQKVS